MIVKSSLLEEGPYLASKFLKLYFFLSIEELKTFFMGLDFSIHPLGGVLEDKTFTTSKEEFFQKYETTLFSMFNHETYKMPSFLLTTNKNDLYIVDVNTDKKMLKIRRPVLFLKPLFFTISEGKVYETLGKEAIFWGFSLSYPQIFQDPKTNHFEKVDDRFENTRLFKEMRKKLRLISKCISFEKEGEKIVSSFRLGKELIIKDHPGLTQSKINLWSGNEY